MLKIIVAGILFVDNTDLLHIDMIPTPVVSMRFIGKWKPPYIIGAISYLLQGVHWNPKSAPTAYAGQAQGG